MQVIKDLEMEELPEITEVGSCNHKGLYKRKKAEIRLIRVMSILAWGWRKRPPAKKCRRPLEHSPAYSLILDQGNLLQTSDLQNHKLIKL